MTPTASPEVWRLPQTALRLSMVEMARDGTRRCEGVALWLGRQDEQVVEITDVVALRGIGIVRRPDYLSISPELLNDVTDVAIQRGLFLVGQIHSHPPGCGVGLSEPDRRYGIRAPGYLSAVAPNFAVDQHTPVEACGFHVFEAGAWRRFDASECARRVEVTEGVTSSLLVVGEDVSD